MSNVKTNILIVDDDEGIRTGCEILFKDMGYQVFSTSSPKEGLEIARNHQIRIVFVDYKMPEMNGIEFMKLLKNDLPQTDVVMITGYATIEMAILAIRQGAYDYIPKPFKAEKIIAVIDKIIEKQKILGRRATGELELKFQGKAISIIGKSPPMQELFQTILKVAPTESTILILGESGTGKELIAKAIHANSRRKGKPFYAIDCGSLVESLFESELFGHIKGSFTGAISTKHGAFELADGGTFFFDEIGNISLNLQTKILRAIQEREIRRIGGTKTIPVDVRVVAATNLDLRRAVEEGRFREDLYYRISVIPVHLPPLRERPEDISLLIDHFLEKHQIRREKKPIQSISAEALKILQNYHWPGNIRELENVIERALIIEDSNQINPSSLPAYLQKKRQKNGPSIAKTLEDVEIDYIKEVLELTKRNISQSAKILDIDRKTLYEKIKKYSL